MAIAEGKKFDFALESEIATEIETFRFLEENLLIVAETNEFSAVCPFSGLPDVAKVKVEYYPRGLRCLELKSLKYYYTSFRPVGIYQEAVTSRIFRDLQKALHLDFDSIRVTTVYNTRGGIDVTCNIGGLK